MHSLTRRLYTRVVPTGWYICVCVYPTWKVCMYTHVRIYHSPGKMSVLTDHHLHVGHTHSHTTLKVECPTRGVFRVHHQVQYAVALS